MTRAHASALRSLLWRAEAEKRVLEEEEANAKEKSSKDKED